MSKKLLFSLADWLPCYLQASLSTYHGDDDTSYYSKYGVRHNYTWWTQAKWRSARVISYKKRKSKKEVLGYNKYICLSLFSLLSYCGFLAQQDEQHSDQVSWQWWGLISQPKIKLKSTSPRNGISDTLQQQKQHHHLREQKVHWRTVQSCQLCKHIAKTGKDVIEKFILTL